jgi:hypothetical protein
VSINLVKFTAAIAAIRRARAHSRPFPATLEAALPHWTRLQCTGRRASLVVSDSVTSAAVLGWGTPMIAVAPSLVRTLDADELDRVLIHEWAHVQRRDDLVYIAQIAVRAILGWHPALWWIDRRLHVEREIACDEATVAIAGSPKLYAECLVKLASLKHPRRAPLAAPAVGGSSGLRARIAKIVSSHPSIAPVWARSIAVTSVTILCVMSMGLGGLSLVEAAVVAMPLASSRALSPAALPLSVSTTPMTSPDTAADPSIRTLRREAPVQRPLQVQTPAPVPTPLPLTDSGSPTSAAGSHGLHAVVIAETNPELPGVPVHSTVPDLPPARPGVTTEPPRAPWTLAADAGVTIGRKSKDAGLATAGFFSRVARRVAGTF